MWIADSVGVAIVDMSSLLLTVTLPCSRLYVLHRVTVCAFYALVAWLLWSFVSRLSGLLSVGGQANLLGHSVGSIGIGSPL